MYYHFCDALNILDDSGLLLQFELFISVSNVQSASTITQLAYCAAVQPHVGTSTCRSLASWRQQAHVNTTLITSPKQRQSRSMQCSVRNAQKIGKHKS